MTPAYAFFHWLAQTYLGKLMQGNDYLFPTVEALHIMGSVALVASTSVLSLRLAGLFLTEYPSRKSRANFCRGLGWALDAKSLLELFYSSPRPRRRMPM